MGLNLTDDPASGAQWRLLIGRAEALTGYVLDRGTEDYLIRLLIRVGTNPELIDGLLSLDRLVDPPAGAARIGHLRAIGDQCLLFSGLFPHYATERSVRLGYFVSLGSTAYGNLRDLVGGEDGALYARLSDGFGPLVELLHAMREIVGDGTALTPLRAFELWIDTGSRRALGYIRSVTRATPVRTPPADTPLM